VCGQWPRVVVDGGWEGLVARRVTSDEKVGGGRSSGGELVNGGGSSSGRG
jgi:hypothetical protein